MYKYLLIVGIILSSILGFYGFVFGGNFNFNSDVKFAGSVGDTVFLDNSSLDSIFLVFQSKINISSAEVYSNCEVQSQFITSHKDLYFFELNYAEAPACKNGNFVLRLGDEVIANASGKIELASNFSLYNYYSDFPDSDLEVLETKLSSIQEKNAIYKNYTGKDFITYFSYFSGQRAYYDAETRLAIVSHILQDRQEKYISPVDGYTFGTIPSKYPNSGRPYRASYTDGVHHGWDIDAPIGTPVVALDDAIVVRIVSTFEDSDFSRIVYGENLSDEQKTKNLDILRGKQVWIKTMKGEVVFYGHLDTIAAGLEEGDVVSRGQKLGNVGASGVPEVGYDDFHLHFEVSKNPYNAENAGSYDFWDYMFWEWQTKGMSYEQTLQATKEIFE